uniref:Uncharacterized protein n=1 Tax=Shewanella sp. 33B TaxID=592146 RepID=B9W0T2_9GAMM|nr:hypothetical protein [Shewanella sp. 33B]ACM47540.1 hypothetical protein [Shewanella sp. 33B]
MEIKDMTSLFNLLGGIASFLAIALILQGRWFEWRPLKVSKIYDITHDGSKYSTLIFKIRSRVPYETKLYSPQVLGRKTYSVNMHYKSIPVEEEQIGLSFLDMDRFETVPPFGLIEITIDFFEGVRISDAKYLFCHTSHKPFSSKIQKIDLLRSQVSIRSKHNSLKFDCKLKATFYRLWLKFTSMFSRNR